MSGFWMIPDDYEYPQATFSGSAHSVSSDKEDDPAASVRKIAEEVTGKEFPAPTKSIGFY
jgi:hypothetical protein